MSNTEVSKPRVIKANHVLQAKVGSGPLDKNTLDACERVIQNNDFDFAPLAKEFLQKLEIAIKNASAREGDLDQLIQDMTQPVMELKANASTFKYNLIGNLANIMLSFLEGVKEIDDTVIQIVDAHHKTLFAIVQNKMMGDGGDYGKKLEQELKDACKRYFQAKRK